MNIIGERRTKARRAEDDRAEHFKGVLILAFAMTLFLGISLGYYLAAAESARMVLEAAK